MKYEFFEVKDVKEYILGLSKEQLVNKYDSLDKYIRTNPLLTGMDKERLLALIEIKNQ